MVAKEDSNPGSLDCESGVLPLSYRAPPYMLTQLVQDTEHNWFIYISAHAKI